MINSFKNITFENTILFSLSVFFFFIIGYNYILLSSKQFIPFFKYNIEMMENKNEQQTTNTKESDGSIETDTTNKVDNSESTNNMSVILDEIDKKFTTMNKKIKNIEENSFIQYCSMNYDNSNNVKSKKQKLINEMCDKNQKAYNWDRELLKIV
jgi:hypothetical protein